MHIGKNTNFQFPNYQFASYNKDIWKLIKSAEICDYFIDGLSYPIWHAKWVVEHVHMIM
jgi:hypothetical protein